MPDPFLGEIRMFAGTFAPRGYAFCHGQLLAISENTALFSLLGAAYGGDGRTTFALPDLRSRVPVGAGKGLGLTEVTLGAKYGVEKSIAQVQLTSSQTLEFDVSATAPPSLPQVDVATSSSNPQSSFAPGRIPLQPELRFTDPADAGGTEKMDINAFLGANLATTGSTETVQVPLTVSAQSDVSVDTHQPSLGISYIIALQGVFPSRS
ncbi:MAG: hypothetical protein MHM6MM_001350 [Cercozoa sp. M6MM]